LMKLRKLSTAMQERASHEIQGGRTYLEAG